jgi:hypothetical protein
MGERGGVYRVFVVKIEGSLEDAGIDGRGRIILERILQKSVGRA